MVKLPRLAILLLGAATAYVLGTGGEDMPDYPVEFF